VPFLFSQAVDSLPTKLQEVARRYIKLTKSERELFRVWAAQRSEGESETEEHAPLGPVVKTRPITPTKREELLPGLTDIEKIAFTSHRIGIGTVRMSAYLKYSDRQLRRILIRAYEKVAEYKRDQNVR